MTANNKIKAPLSVLPEPVPSLHSLSPYVQGQGHIQGHADPIKLSSNESNLGPSPRAIEAYQNRGKELFRYPDGDQAGLRNAIADVFKLDADRIICGNGSEELLLLLIRAYLSPGDEAICSEFSFAMAKTHAIAQGAKVITAAEPELVPSVDEILKQVSSATRMVLLASPNNPVGRYLPASEVKRLHDHLPENVLLVLDSAYADYVTEEDFEAGAHFVDAADNVVMTRTFSKLYGLAGLRIGWAYCPAHIIETLQRIRTPFNANAAALAAAEAAVKDIEYTNFVREHNNSWLAKLRSEINGIGFEVIPSVANFYLIRFPETAGQDVKAVWDHFLSKGIIARPINAGGPQNCLRLTVGLDHENEAVIAALREFKQGK